MSYRNKTYVCLDYDEDKNYYNMMRAWKDHDKIDFDFYDAHDINTLMPYSSEETIKAKLRERLNNAKNFIVLIGAKTKHKDRFVRWEQEIALKLGLPSIAVNLNGKREMDSDRVPPIIKDALVIHVSFNMKIIKYALDNWPTSFASHKAKGDTGPHYYKKSVYDDLGL